MMKYGALAADFPDALRSLCCCLIVGEGLPAVEPS